MTTETLSSSSWSASDALWRTQQQKQPEMTIASVHYLHRLKRIERTEGGWAKEAEEMTQRDDDKKEQEKENE